MPDLNNNGRRKGLEFAKALAVFAQKAPDDFSESLVHALVSRLQKHYGYSRRLKKRAIREFLEKEGGTSSVQDIAAAFRWRPDIVTSLATEMETEGVAEFYSTTPAGNGPGRPARRIRLK